MAITPKNLVPSKAMENVQTTQYTATNLRAVIDKCTVTNISGGAVTFSLNLVPSGGSAGNSNKIISSKSLQANECYQCPEVIGHMIEAGGFISTIAGAASALTLDISGREIS